jgi:hypothetical protein
MMLCPTCGGGTDVKDSRVSVFHDKPSIRRRRVCRACKRRITTFEVVIGHGNTYQKMAAIPLAVDHASRALLRLRQAIVDAGVLSNGVRKENG